MSTVVTTNLKLSTETASRSLRGVAASWAGIEINGTTSGSLNVSSVTDGGVGTATVNQTSAFTNTNYSVENSVNIAVATAYSFNSSRISASQYNMVFYVGGALADPLRYCGAAHGDLA